VIGVIDQRYEVLEERGSGSQGTLSLALELDSGRRVALKELDLTRVDDWKAIELFEREAAILETLDHPHIPGYVDAFHLDDDSGSRFFLAQEFIEGQSLEVRFDQAQLFDEYEARQFLGSMLEILEYLHRLNPPVVHRDIKPSNIIERTDGEFALVDFGAVQTILPEATGGSTVVGTSGYMPPEQLMGRASPASDLYSLAATTVAMVSGHEPEDLPVERMKLAIDEHVDLSDDLTGLLDAMLEPVVEKRLGDAAQARQALDSGGVPALADGGGLPSAPAYETLQRELQESDDLRPESPRSSIRATPHSMVINVPAPKPDPRVLLWPALGVVVVIVTGIFFCILVPVVLGLLAAVVWKCWPHMFPRSQHVIINADEVTVEWRRDNRVVKTETSPVDRMYLPEVNRAGLSPDGDEYSGKFLDYRKLGLVFSDRDGQEIIVGHHILSRNRLSLPGRYDDRGELDWMAAQATAYLRYVRGEFDD
jgi:serine/threonine protein kinase